MTRSPYYPAVVGLLCSCLLLLVIGGCAAKGMPQASLGQETDPLKREMLRHPKLPTGSVLPAGTSAIRVSNPVKSTVLVVFRQDDRVGSFFVDQGKSQQFDVQNGCYEMFFIYANNPAALFQGDQVCVHGQIGSITLQEVAYGNYNIHQVQ